MQIGDRVIITPEANTRAGERGVITLIDDAIAVVRFDDGDELAFLIDDDELLKQDIDRTNSGHSVEL